MSNDHLEPELALSLPIADINEQMHLVLLRQLINSVHAVNAQLTHLNTTNLDMVQRLTRIESNKLEDTVAIAMRNHEALMVRVHDLEQVRQRNIGALGLIDWVKDAMPWLVTLGVGAFAYYTKK